MNEALEKAMELATTGEEVAALTKGLAPQLLIALKGGPGRSTDEQLESLFVRLRQTMSLPNVQQLGGAHGYRIEDISALCISLPDGDLRMVAEWLRKRLLPEVALELRSNSPAMLAAVVRERTGFAPGAERYERDAAGRVLVEAFELHVVEHCNLRCANCCNMSPLVAKRTLTVEEIAHTCQRMAESLHAKILKVMGGEPLLHPDVTGVLLALRASGLGDRVRLFTNGLLLTSQPDSFWETLEDLTISSYASAPAKPAILELARARARQYGFVLNIKPVNEFSQVLSPRFQHDDAKTQSTFNRCWLRHRCLIVRDGRFYMCTRAAYAGDFLERTAHEASPTPLDRSDDGIAVDGADFAGRLERYMNRQAPLAACRYCFGGDGAMEPHYQLSKREVRDGILSRQLHEDRR